MSDPSLAASNVRTGCSVSLRWGCDTGNILVQLVKPEQGCPTNTAFLTV